jgi:SAM-dependent methyltransferase
VKILELGCGKRKGWNCPYDGEIIGVDIDKNSQADVIWDLEKFPYPFKNNEFDAIYMRHCLEHLSDTFKVMKEIHRITKPNGRVRILVPYGVSAWALGNLTHKKFFSYSSLDGIENFKILKVQYNYIHKGYPKFQSWRGKSLRILTKPLDWAVNLNPRIYDKLLRHYLGDADEIEWELQVLK